MPCFQCGRQFSFTNKEVPCKSCNRVFCSKCVKYKVSLPQHGNKHCQVCFKCYDQITNPDQPPPPKLEPPKILLDRMAALELHPPGAPPNVLGACGGGGCSREHRSHSPAVPHIDALELRLEALRDIPKPDEVPSHKELEERLRKLRETDFVQHTTPHTAQSDKVSHLIDQIHAENKLSSGGLMNTDNNYEDDEELPWCCICNKNATLRCTECDGDLFCKSCYRRTHRTGEEKHHQPEPYTSKPRGNVT